MRRAHARRNVAAPDLGVAVAILSNTEANFGEAEALAFARLALP